MNANAFIADLLWDVNHCPFAKHDRVAALFVDTYRIADHVPFKEPLRFNRFNLREGFNGPNMESRRFSNLIIVDSILGGRLLDMRDAIPADQYPM